MGTVALFHLANGSFAITFEDFSIDSAAHTDVILVPNKDVTKDGDIDKSTIVDLGPLKGTSGMQDFAVPSSAGVSEQSWTTRQCDHGAPALAHVTKLELGNEQRTDLRLDQLIATVVRKQRHKRFWFD